MSLMLCLVFVSGHTHSENHVAEVLGVTTVSHLLSPHIYEAQCVTNRERESDDENKNKSWKLHFSPCRMVQTNGHIVTVFGGSWEPGTGIPRGQLPDYLSLNLVKKDPYVVTNHIIFNDQKRE